MVSPRCIQGSAILSIQRIKTKVKKIYFCSISLTLIDANCSETENVVNLIPSDFNGDSIIDLMVIFKNGTNNYLSIRVYFGNKTSKNQNDICNKREKKSKHLFKC